MEVVELKVQVEKSQLAALEKDIKALQSKRIKISVDASGFDALSKSTKSTAQSVQAYGSAVAQAQGSGTKLTQAQQKAAAATEKTAAAYTKAAQSAEKAQSAQAQYASQAEKSASATSKAAAQTEKMSKSASLLGDSLGNVAVKMAAWQVMGDLVATPIRALKEALDTMKAVDDQLVDVRKVTGFTETQMKALEEQSYATASAYGEAADEYLASVAEFARAGYGEQAEALAELSTKTKIVGDTTAEVANQFLLSVDAAYQYQGSVEKLSAVLDGVNEIDNKYATSISNIAEGLGKVAPIAAQAGVGVDELSAAIGTITAVTQRSGTEAATAFRALMLNIMGDTKTEIDEGVTWTTGEIAGLRDVLKIYASDVVEAADATGSLINPMEAIGALAQSMEDGVLTEQKLMEMVSDIGGKLRTSQLLALIQNWDMYESMLADFSNAAGSADKEVENAMNSWSRKAEVLKNTWTQFVQGMLSTDTIKGGIDGLTGVIDALDSKAGHAAIEFAALSLAITGVAKAGSALKGSKIVETLAGISDTFNLQKSLGAMEGVTGAKNTLGAVGGTLASIGKTLAKSPVVWAAAIMAVVEVVDLLTVSFEEQSEKVQELQSQYDQLNAEGGTLDTLQKRVAAGEQLNSQEQKNLTILQAQSDELERQLRLEQEKAIEIWQRDYGTGAIGAEYGDQRTGDYRVETRDVTATKALTEAQAELNNAFMDGRMSEEEFRDGLSGVIANGKDYYDSLMMIKDAGYEVSEAQEEFIRRYELMVDQLGNTEEGLMAVRLTMENFTKAWEVAGEADMSKTVVNVDALKQALEDAGATAEQIQAVLDNMAEDESVVQISVEGDTEDALEALEELGIAIESEDGKTITINYDSLVEMGQEIGLTQEQITILAGNLEALGNVNFSDTEGNILSLKELMLGLGEIKVDMSPLALAAQNAANEADQTKGKFVDLGETKANPDITVTGAEAAKKAADGVAQALRNIPTAVTSTITVKREGATSVLAKNAGGTQNFGGGLTLLGDEPSPDRSPKPELVVANGSAFLAGTEGPEVRNLPKGAQIYSYSDTKKIFGRGGTGKEFPAFASGTVSLWKYWGNKNTTSSSGGSSSGGSSSSESSGKGSSSSSSSSSKSTGSSKKSRGSSGSSSGKDARQEELEDQIKLLESELDLMEAQGRPAGELAAKMREIQRALHEQAEYMRSIGGDQTEINKLSKEWWDVQKDIKEAYQDEMESTRDLLESQLELMENQGRSAEERIRKLEEIQDNLHEEADYLRSIEASQEEINELSNEWWDIQKDIKEIQKDLWDELEEAVDKELERAKEARDLELAALDKAKEKLDEERQAKEEKLTLEEKILAVQEAQAALANAQNERTIRTYNAATGQWEWVADAETVKSAAEALEDAEKDLEDYKADLEYQAAVDAIEARREAIESAYEALEESWEDIIDSVQEPTREISEILDDIAKNGTPLMKQQIDNVGKLLGDLNNYIEGAIGSTTGESYYGGGGLPSMDFTSEGTDYSALMDRAQTVEEFNHWASLREEKMEAQGIDPEAEGWRTNAEIFEEWKAKNPGWEAGVGSSAGILGGGSSGGSSSGSSSGVSSAVSGVASSIGSAIAGALGGGAKKAYDSGGVLKGLGGIKATAEDEMILPPDITAAMLSPAADATFQARLAELGVLYGAKSGPVTLPAGVSQSRDSHDHHGDSYTFGDVTLTEEQARGMTVYELAQRSRSLGLYGWQH